MKTFDEWFATQQPEVLDSMTWYNMSLWARAEIMRLVRAAYEDGHIAGFSEGYNEAQEEQRMNS